ncbi:hypothetical protein ELQ90_03395 [Labedella phragmitis]|uniref:Integral membrane bound transporter domain-containing protein n=1 Tax=Labedella phragmitis TaxID=2498849 RepID=A0A3S3ZSZ6_9MICO|nr:FUSC family protein [Labedella phragmitis]RWZ52989.1 hypothetical protein ELQ90_03395 [Labedella phragmitis]
MSDSPETNPIVMSTSSTESSTRRSAFVLAIRRAVRPARLLHAAKTAIAATIAWLLGGLLPGDLADYAYYAPLGALISMAPTLMDSVRSSIQTVAGLALGVLVAWGLIAIAAPPFVAVPVAILVGTVLAGLTVLGPGKDYIPIAALFVLIIGGANANDFSIGYVAQMGLGMVIGIVVNLVVMPPLRVDDSAIALSALRRTGARTLEAMAQSLSTGGDGSDWERELLTFESRLAEAATAVRGARESRRANPRARRMNYDVDEDLDDLAALRRARVHLEAMGAVLRGSEHERPLGELAGAETLAPAAELLGGLGRLMELWNEERAGAPTPENGDGAESRDPAEVERELRERTESPDAQPLVSAIAVAAGRMREDLEERRSSRVTGSTRAATRDGRSAP